MVSVGADEGAVALRTEACTDYALLRPAWVLGARLVDEGASCCGACELGRARFCSEAIA